MTTGLARIPVQNLFCNFCGLSIKETLLQIENITNVYLYPNEAMIVFNFVKANELSSALNALTDLGYPPKGDKILKNKLSSNICSC